MVPGGCEHRGGLLVGMELARLAADVRPAVDLAVLGITVVVSVASNMALGFVPGVGVHYLARLVSERWRLDKRRGSG